MTIIQQPEKLSLSNNIKSFIVNAAEIIPFTLIKGDVVLLTQRYETAKNGMLEIDVKDIIHASLRYQLRESGEVYEQTGLAADFTAIIDQTEVRFRVVRGGVAHLEDTATTFLKQNWLTWQPTEKKVTYYSPEFLTYYAVEDCAVKLKAYFSESDNETITYASLTGGKAYTLPLQYAVVAGKLNNKLPGVYDVWVESAAGERLTYVQRYRAEAAKSLQEDWVLFENSLGGLDCFRAYGEKSLEAKHTHNVAKLDEETEEYRVDTERIYTKSTGYLSKDETKWLLDFFPSTGKYIFDGNVIRKITVTESSAKMTNQFDPCGYSFSYQFAEAVPLLNLARAKQPLEVLNIEIPEVGNFTLPPRLAEVGRLPLSEGVLFPVQNPYAENWGTTTMGAIAQVIGQLLEEMAGTGGGVGHQHKNIDLLNLLSMAGQYLTVGGKKIHAGYADEAGNLKGGDGKYIRKDIDDTVHTVTTFLKGIRIGQFVSGMIGGSGASIYPDENGKTILEVDKIHAREELMVPQITFNCIDVISGDKANTFAYGTIKEVDTNTKTATLDLLDEQVGTLHADDICRGVFHNISGGNDDSDAYDENGFLRYSGFSTSYFTPVRITENKPGSMTFEYEIQPGTDVHPMPGMNFFAYGNFTDKERQSITYENRYYTRRLVDVDNWTIDPDRNIAMQDGLLEGLNIGGMEMHGYGTFQTNNYFTGVQMQFTPEQLEVLSGKDAYTVSLTSYGATVIQDDDGNLGGLHGEYNVVTAEKNVVSGEKNVVVTRSRLTAKIQVYKGDRQMFHSRSVKKGGYTVSVRPVGCEAEVSNGIMSISSITDKDNCYVELSINCEGVAMFEQVYTVTAVGSGKQGIQGCILRKSEWQEGVEYRNDGSLTSGTRYLDVALLRNNAAATGWDAYECLATHISTDTNKPGTEEGKLLWKAFGVNVSSIFTSLIIAKDASIDFIQGNELLIKDDKGIVVGGLAGGASKIAGTTPVRIWVGSDLPDNAPFRVLHDGTAYATRLHISGDSTFGGKLDAVEGTFKSLVCADGEGNELILSASALGSLNPSIYLKNPSGKTVFSVDSQNYPSTGTAINLFRYNTSGNETNSVLIHSNGLIKCSMPNKSITIDPQGITFAEGNVATLIYPAKRTQLVCTGGTYREISDDVSIIMISGGTSYVYLPNPSVSIGRAIYFKHTGGAAYIRSVSGGVRPPSDWAVKTEWGVGSTIAFFAVSDAQNWNIFFCG